MLRQTCLLLPSFPFLPPPACTKPLPCSHTHAYLFCIPLFSPSCYFDLPLPWSVLSPVLYFFFFTLHLITLPAPSPFSPHTNALISLDRGGWGRHNVHLTFNWRLSQHAALKQTGCMCMWVEQRYERFHGRRTSGGRILQYLLRP